MTVPSSPAARGLPTCLVLQHVAPERPYHIADELSRAGVRIELCRVFDGDRAPDDIAGYQGLVVMGGPMSASSDEGFPSRQSELSLLEKALVSSIPVLGVCLGAQLLAVAAGANVYPGSAGAEIGWGPVSFTPAASQDALLAGLPPDLDVMHWHGDTFDLPVGAVRLASNARYANQAFRCGTSAWGLQFHLEVGPDAVSAFLDAFGDEALANGAQPDQVTADTPNVLAVLGPARDLVLGRFSALVAAAAD